MTIARAKFFPLWWCHMHKREGEAEGYVSCLAALDNDCPNKQKGKWNKPHYLNSSINLQSQHRSWSVLCISSHCWLLSPPKQTNKLKKILKQFFYLIEPPVVIKLCYLLFDLQDSSHGRTFRKLFLPIHVFGGEQYIHHAKGLVGHIKSYQK